MQAKTSAVRTLLESRLSREGERGAALITMASDMVARALRGDLHWYHHVLRRDLAKAISGATGFSVQRMLMAEPDARHGSKRYKVSYSESLATRMREKYWTRLWCGLQRDYGEKNWEKGKDQVWDALLADARPYGLSAWNDPDNPAEVLRNTPGENLLTTLFYFTAFASIHDSEALEQISNLVRLLPYAVPIGEYAPEPGNWVYVVHQVR